MIFACDLDQTLIYSRNSMGATTEEELVPVELYEGRHISFMTQAAYQMLQLLSKQVYFVPVTTRIYEQYERIFGLQQGINPRYAIVSNGARVLFEGKPDLNWENQVRNLVSERCAPVAEIKMRFDKLASSEWLVKETYCDDLFYSIVVKRDLVPENLMGELEDQLQGYGWSCSLQGRKIYLVPDRVSKGLAVQYVKELLGEKSLFAAGDSLLDESMLRIADEAAAPKHGELYRKYGVHAHIQFTEQTGIKASEEILARLASKMEVTSTQ